MGVESIGSSTFANLMMMHDGSTFNQFSSRYETQDLALREENLKALLIRIKELFQNNEVIIDICKKLGLEAELQEAMDELNLLE